MSRCLLIQTYDNGSSLNNYIATTPARAKTIAELLNGEVEIFDRVFNKDENVDFKTRIANIQLYDDIGNKEYFSGRVSRDETQETIKSKLLPFTIGNVTYSKATVSLSSLK